ncbi:MAG TPA: TIGR04255 family protein [Methanospirillum sp.]|uniref:TIGR04255 family protein n=1 Tax=Methanospirillum sp. TaxID=45200 RepID=UPI002CDE50CD|nr:TIGR04255 family protein [Methanospirillum sp.]HWQ63813.1 TIGR04255 family protein [Methanospirillum sp.]
MNSPLPHNFSRSPVEEVCCSLVLITEPVSFTIAPPYPGWGSIRNRLTDEIAGLKDVSEVAGCSLQYRDRFLLDTDEFSRVINEIKPDLFHTDLISDKEYLVIPITQWLEHRVCIRTSHETGEQLAWILTFNIQTCAAFRPEKPDDILSWFDKAHAVIHTLFDLIVPEEIIEQIR